MIKCLRLGLNNGKDEFRSGDLRLEYDLDLVIIGGSGEIRTHEGLAPSLVFKTSAFNHSATLPLLLKNYS